MATINFVVSGLMSNSTLLRGTSRAYLSTQASTSPTVLSYSTSLTPTPERSGHSLSFLSNTNSIYSFGGVDSTNVYHNDLWIYSISTRNWSLQVTTGSIPSTRSEHAMFLYNGLLYVFGGWNGTTYFNDLHSFNPVTNVWTVVSTTGTIQPRYGFAHAVVGTKLYIFGGIRSSGANGGRQQNVQSLDLSLATPAWSATIVNLGTARDRFSAVAIGGMIYLYGGDGGSNGLLSDTISFDTVTNTKATLTTTGTDPGGLAGYAMFTSSSTIYVYGGLTSTGASNSLYSFNTVTKVWAHISNSLLVGSRQLMGVAQNGTTAYIVSGFSTTVPPATYIDLWSIDLTSPLLTSSQLTGDVLVNSTSFTLSSLTFTAFVHLGNVAVRVAAGHGSLTGPILVLSNLKVLA